MNRLALPQSICTLSTLFAGGGYKLYLVGGFVRNIVLGLPGGDFDVCSTAHPAQAADIARKAGLTVVEKAVELGTIEIHLHCEGVRHVFEHTTFRRDFDPSGGDHRPYRVEFTQDMAQDAQRRDFTIGALYLDIESGNIADPTGRGLEDARQGVIRAAADNPDDTIRDDGLRIMRMARFAAELGFEIAPELLKSAQRHAALLADISAERKRDELTKILMSDTKYPKFGGGGPLNGLSLLRDTGALFYVLPRLFEAKGVAQSPVFHKYDVMDHCLHACAASPADLVLRLSALLHDIGKPAALKQSGKMYEHEKIGEELARKELGDLRFDNKTKNAVAVLIRYHMFDLEGKAKPKTIRRRAVMLGRQAFEKLIALRRADVLGSGFDVGVIKSAENWQAELDRMLSQHVPWHVSELDISGHEVSELLGSGPSEAVGHVLSQLHQECVQSPAANNNASLRRRAAQLAKEHHKLLK